MMSNKNYEDDYGNELSGSDSFLPSESNEHKSEKNMWSKINKKLGNTNKLYLGMGVAIIVGSLAIVTIVMFQKPSQDIASTTMPPITAPVDISSTTLIPSSKVASANGFVADEQPIVKVPAPQPLSVSAATEIPQEEVPVDSREMMRLVESMLCRLDQQNQMLNKIVTGSAGNMDMETVVIKAEVLENLNNQIAQKQEMIEPLELKIAKLQKENKRLRKKEGQKKQAKRKTKRNTAKEWSIVGMGINSVVLASKSSGQIIQLHSGESVGGLTVKTIDMQKGIITTSYGELYWN